jgi:hypothetical protein
VILRANTQFPQGKYMWEVGAWFDLLTKEEILKNKYSFAVDVNLHVIRLPWFYLPDFPYSSITTDWVSSPDAVLNQSKTVWLCCSIDSSLWALPLVGPHKATRVHSEWCATKILPCPGTDGWVIVWEQAEKVETWFVFYKDGGLHIKAHQRDDSICLVPHSSLQPEMSP